MPFGGGLKKLATNSSLNSSKNIIDPSPHRQKVGSATLPQGEGYLVFLLNGNKGLQPLVVFYLGGLQPLGLIMIENAFTTRG